MTLLRSSAVDGIGQIISILVYQHEYEQLVIWGNSNMVKICNFCVRQDAMNDFKLKMQDFVAMNTFQISAGDKSKIIPYLDAHLEGKDFIEDSVHMLANTLMDREHYRTLYYKLDVIKIFVVKGENMTYIITNLMNNIDLSEDDAANNTTAYQSPIINLRNFDTEELIREYYGMALYAGELQGYSNKIILSIDLNQSLLISDIDTGVPLKKLKVNFHGIHKSIVYPQSDMPMLIVNDEPNISLLCLNKNRNFNDKIINNDDCYSSPLIEERETITVFSADEDDEDDGEVTEFALLSHPNHKMLVTAHDSGMVRVWSLLDFTLLRIFNFNVEGVHTISVLGGFHPLLVTGSYYGAIQVWSLQCGSLLRTLQRSNVDTAISSDNISSNALSSTHQSDSSVLDTEPCVALAISDPENLDEALLVSADTVGKLSFWDLHDVLCDLKWEKRKHFCIFLKGSGFMRKRNNNSRRSSYTSGMSYYEHSQSGSVHSGRISNTDHHSSEYSKYSNISKDLLETVHEAVFSSVVICSYIVSFI